MSVDCSFVGRADPSAGEGFVLAVGTNDGKDFETLLEALPLGLRLVVVTDPYNAEKVRKHPCFGGSVEVRESVPAVELLGLYKSAGVVVVPLADTPHGSGHTVLLETMGMGKIVVVSNVRCMQDYLGGDDAVLSVPPGDAKSLRAAIEESLKYPERFRDMRERAAAVVRSKFNMERFGRRFERLVTDLVAGRSTVESDDFEAAGSLEREEDKSYAPVS
jgi:glycosyltransferase involved in cell wall biosynthesis